MKTIALFGARGMLGSALFERLSRENFLVLPLARCNANLENPDDVDRIFSEVTPNIVINAAAYSNVDGAEKEEELAMTLNADAPEHMALLCREAGADFYHFSTDFVFDGVKGEYTETDIPAPINAYARSKEMGERAVRDAFSEAVIIRTARLFSREGKNVATWMAGLAKKKKTIPAVSDERGNFTCVSDVAEAMATLLTHREQYPETLYHFCASESCTPFAFAKYLVAKINSSAKVKSIFSADLDRAAQRPLNCSLQNTRFPALPSWRDALDRFCATKENS